MTTNIWYRPAGSLLKRKSESFSVDIFGTHKAEVPGDQVNKEINKMKFLLPMDLGGGRE